MQLAVLGDSPTDSFPPAAKTGGLQFATHQADNLTFLQACALSDLFKAGPILPGKAHDQRGLLAVEFGLHERGTMAVKHELAMNPFIGFNQPKHILQAFG